MYNITRPSFLGGGMKGAMHNLAVLNAFYLTLLLLLLFMCLYLFIGRRDLREPECVLFLVVLCFLTRPQYNTNGRSIMQTL